MGHGNRSRIPRREGMRKCRARNHDVSGMTPPSCMKCAQRSPIAVNMASTDLQECLPALADDLARGLNVAGASARSALVSAPTRRRECPNTDCWSTCRWRRAPRRHGMFRRARIPCVTFTRHAGFCGTTNPGRACRGPSPFPCVHDASHARYPRNLRLPSGMNESLSAARAFLGVERSVLGRP
jgi:hypothetical protein